MTIRLVFKAAFGKKLRLPAWQGRRAPSPRAVDARPSAQKSGLSA
jgi:hypothetical protein